MSLYSTSPIPENYPHSTKSQQRSELKQQIEKFLKSAAAESNERHLCSRCGAEMKSIDTTFSLLGTNSTWKIKVPLCRCTAEDTARNSDDCSQQTDTEF